MIMGEQYLVTEAKTPSFFLRSILEGSIPGRGLSQEKKKKKDLMKLIVGLMRCS